MHDRHTRPDVRRFIAILLAMTMALFLSPSSASEQMFDRVAHLEQLADSVADGPDEQVDQDQRDPAEPNHATPGMPPALAAAFPPTRNARPLWHDAVSDDGLWMRQERPPRRMPHLA